MQRSQSTTTGAEVAAANLFWVVSKLLAARQKQFQSI